LKIVIVADHAHVNGGQAKVSIESAKGLARLGHDVVYFAAVGPIDPGLAAAGVKTVVLDQPDVTSAQSLTRFGVQWLWNVAAARELARVLDSCDPHDTIIHIHAWAKALSPSIGPVLKRTKIPRVFTIHEYYLACPNGGFYDYPVAQPCLRRPMSFNCIAHNCDSRSYMRKLMRVARHELLRAGMLDSLTDVITISRLQREILQPYLPASMRYHHIANPIDVAPLGQKPQAPLGGFIFVGRLSAEKGAKIFAEAAQRAGQRAVFVGDGPAADELKALYPGTTILGWKSPAEVKQFMRAARAVVFPSVWYEGQPLTVLESLALGTPVIVSDVCAGREAIEDGVNGLWFKSADPDSLAHALQRLSDDDTARQMSRAAYDRYWAAPLTLDRHLDALVTLYRAALGEPPQSTAKFDASHQIS
jgi:glycosyltransferase involved in cell wall biosynthesis